MTNCKYEGILKTKEEDSEVYTEISYNKISFSDFIIMEGGFLQFSLQTICNEGQSEPLVFEVTDPELVMDLECYSYALKKVYCSWSPASKTTDLHFFYKLVKENGEGTVTEIQECLLYNSTGDVKTGCHLQASTADDIHVVFKATLNNTLVRNTFRRDPLKDVRPPPLNWSVTESVDTFDITWVPPEMLQLGAWNFVIHYTECAENKEIHCDDTTSCQLKRVPDCKYCIWIEARSKIGKGKTPLSDEKCFDPADGGFNPWLLAAIFIPLVVAFLAVVICCFWIYKDRILPKVPGPRDLLSDDLGNNNVNSLYKLYVPAEEKENCCVTLIADTQTNKPHC
uniref:Uncharacterized LOC108239408 n=2 Tax=Kryptolebias marmoratus TaxID=37003 RepID=A0A3Q2ZQ97_KRYMA